MMARWKRIWQKIKEGKLRQVLSELSWIYGYGRRYRAAVAWYIFLGVLGTGMSLAASVLCVRSAETPCSSCLCSANL